MPEMKQINSWDGNNNSDFTETAISSTLGERLITQFEVYL